MWNLKKIPKIAHFYYGGNTLPYLRYLSISTFHQQNPDWQINFYYPKTISRDVPWLTYEHKDTLLNTDFFSKLYDLDIILKEVDFEDIGIDNNLSEVHKSDFLRLYLLSTVGGLWSDTDIFYYRPINNIDINQTINDEANTCFCIDLSKDLRFCHYIGFLMSDINNEAFKKLFYESKENFNKTQYQCIGTKLYSKIFPTIRSIKEQFKSLYPINISKNSVYPYNSKEISNIYTINTTNSINTKEQSNIGLHWYGGHPLTYGFLRSTDGGLKNLPNNLLGKLINEVQHHPAIQ